MTPAIELRNLSFAYPAQRPALDGVTFTVQPGESVGLIGPNGAGKSTLLLCLVGVRKSSVGSVSVLGLDPARPADKRQIPGRVGVLTQLPDDQLIGPTLEEDVAFGPLNLKIPRDDVERRVAECLTLVSLHGLESRPVADLSGGEKRRAALAGVLAMRPDLILADEPSTFLDVHGRRDLAAILAGLPQARLIASHDHAFLKRVCGRVIWLEAGRVVADGPINDVLARWDKTHGEGW